MDVKEMMMDRLGADAPSSKRKPKTHVHKVEVERGKKGGYVTHHEMRDKEGNMHESRRGPHVIASKKDLQAHMDEHLGDQPDAGEEAGEADEQGIGPAAGGDDDEGEE